MNTAIEISINLKDKYKVDYGLVEEDQIILYLNGLIVTIDIDIKWCRIHRDWDLLRSIDLGNSWNHPEVCSNTIIDVIDRLL